MKNFFARTGKGLVYLLSLLTLFHSSVATDYCDAPPTILNGQPIISEDLKSFYVGMTLNYTCNDGYSFIGNGLNYTVCLNGSELNSPFWQPINITCESVCEDLPTIINGSWLIEGRFLPHLIGESVSFKCKEGYVSRKPNPVITCISKNGVGFWDAENADCIHPLISCNDPGYIENAKRVGNVFTFPHNVTYICIEGYKLSGVATKYCTNQGTWLPQSVPLCEAIVCSVLTPPLNGKIILSSRKYQSVATYQCDRHFKLIGEIERICEESGSWSGIAPTCKEIICLDPGSGDGNIQVYPNKTVHKAGDLVVFKCKYGPHKTSAKCLESGDWTRRPPHCPDAPLTEFPIISSTNPTPSTIDENLNRKASCDDPGKIKNGERMFVGLNINSTVTYTCDEGYKLRGKATLMCMANGKWDLDKLPICVKPLSVPSIIGIVLGVIVLVGLVIGGYFLYKWKEKKIRGYGKKSKALTTDATDLDEITGLEKGRRPIPVTVL